MFRNHKTQALAAAVVAGTCICLLGGCADVQSNASQQRTSNSRDNVSKPADAARETQFVESQFSIDIGDQRAVAGSASNVFIGKVDAVSGTKSLSALPATQFRVSIVENIKGDLTGSVQVSQEGGTEEKTKKVFLLEGDKLLEVGKSYVIAATKNQENGWYTVSAVTGHTELSPTDAAAIAKGARSALSGPVEKWRQSVANQKLPK